MPDTSELAPKLQVSLRLPRVLFVNVGRSPRVEMMREILTCLDIEIEAHELGALDNLSEEDLNALRCQPGEAALSTFINDKIRVVLSKDRMRERFEAIMAELPPHHYDAVVLLTTGFAEDFHANCPTVTGQKAVESIIMSLMGPESTIGQIMPLASQVEFPVASLPDYQHINRAAREGDRDALALAVLDLAEADIILLSSFGYSEADRAIVSRATRKPVILPRRAIAAALRLLLQPNTPSIMAERAAVTRTRYERLTPREREVLQLVCGGHSNKVIASQLGISPKTVEVHRARVMEKMEAPSLAALISSSLTLSNAAEWRG